MADPFWIDGLSYNGNRLRRSQVLQVMTGGTSLAGRGGIVPGSDALRTSLAGSTITVSAGVAYVYQSGQGMYAVVATASTTHALTAAHATLPRVDLVYLRVWDNAVDGSGLNTADTVYLAGTPSASPSAPTPAGTQIYLPLATISVPASGGGSPTVSTSVRPVTVAPGGINPDSGTPGYYAGQYRDDGTGLQRYSGSSWSYVEPLGVGRSLWARKPSNTSRSSTATATADPHLSVSVVANATYKIDCFLVYEALAAADIKFGFNAPASSSGAWWPGGADSSMGAFAAPARWGAEESFSGTMAAGSLGPGTSLAAHAVGTLVTTNAGTFSVIWAQNSGSATATILRANSYLHLTRVD